MAVEYDLLGDPIPEGSAKRGRPPHVQTDEKRRQVMVLAAFGWSMESIAAALGVTPPTLRKHYFRELKEKAEARARVEGAALAALVEQARTGNVQAIDKLLARFARLDEKALSERIVNRGVASPVRKGKKEMQVEAAQQVAGKFAPPSPPRLMN
ncbi:sigma factor-like helix-turn-helix DNA-binding protein [Mongoliimonas terrestris]|uniref:sigma factor-like helix-turn-helix DNA-binding protein n=1 Tax=Mongoliimonas terrestris TaxID=1709001 RepID=UPI00094972D9|nr:sigma factor-like helix-turn-helix DNA-binding protein [Mongoliimonas terrestris]